MSLITTLIPAYKPDDLGETLLGLRRQTFRDFRVILSDDSPGGLITAMLREGRFGKLASELDLQVVRGPGNARLNHLQLLDLWAGRTPFVHIQTDDDVVLPTFYEAHLRAHATGRFGVSVSPRWISQGDSRPVASRALPAVVTDSPLHSVPLDAAQVFATVVPPCDNWLGELTNMVWSAEGAARYPRPPVDRLSYYGLLDISAVLEAVCHQPMVFVRDHLSVFRQHAQQTTHTVGQHGHRVAMLVWAACALHAWQQQRISAQDAVQAITTTVRRCLDLYGEGDEVMNRFYELVQRDGGSLDGLHAAFTRFWLALLATHPGTAPAPSTGLPASAPADPVAA